MTPDLPSQLETQRLLLRPLTLEDLPFFVDLHLDPKVVLYLGGDGSPRSPEVTRSWLDTMLRWYRDDGVGAFAVLRRDNGQLIGRCGLSIFEVDLQPSSQTGSYLTTWGRGSMAAGTPFRTVVEVGYVIHPDQWGHGYATEAAGCWYGFGFQERGEEAIDSIIHADNAASIRVAEKNGLTRAEEVLHMDGRDFYAYRITREEWGGR